MNYKFIAIISFFAVAAGLATIVYAPDVSIPGSNPSVPCQDPLTYRFGEIDARYNITKQELTDIMKKVESLWFTAMDKELLSYSADGGIAIDLVYGKDQERSDEEQAFTQRIESKKQQHEMLENEYKRLAKTYESRRAEFRQSLSEYKQQVNKFNAVVAEWNAKDGVPKNEQSTIKKMERNIKRQKAMLDQKQRNLEFYRQRANAKSDQLNTIIKEEKELIETYNNRFAEVRKFNQGQYIKQGNSETVYIYQFSNRNDLKTVLAHEFGHAMGLDHVDNRESVMYEMMDQQNIFDLKLTKEDIKAIKSRCGN